MAKAKHLADFERGRIVELHKQGLSQRAIAAEVGRSKTVILHFLNDPEGYGTKKSSGRPPKISPALSRRIRLAVRQDTGRSSTQIKAITDADCSPLTIRRHLRGTGFRNKKRLQRPRLLQRHKTARLDFARVHQTWDGRHHDLGCVFLQWNNGASSCAGASNSSWLCGDVAAGIPHD
uniref:Transposase IS30-like HTH domain-containing protein n=1 Tax=Amphilophus citrinellus TaxID=61819 RepID=A0A3Q0R373_AMPCI